MEGLPMKQTIYYMSASMALILSAAGSALARGASGVPEPGTMAMLAGLVGGGLAAYKILRKRK